MSLAAIIATTLQREGVTFMRDGESISSHDVKEMLKDIFVRELLTFPQGGIQKDEYFCDQCADKIQRG